MRFLGFVLTIKRRGWVVFLYQREAGLAALAVGPFVLEWECDPSDAENRAAYAERVARGEHLAPYLDDVNYTLPMGR